MFTIPIPFLWVLALSPLLLVALGLLLFVYSFFSGTIVRFLAIVLVIIGVLDIYFNVNVFQMLGVPSLFAALKPVPTLK